MFQIIPKFQIYLVFFQRRHYPTKRRHYPITWRDIFYDGVFLQKRRFFTRTMVLKFTMVVLFTMVSTTFRTPKFLPFGATAKKKYHMEDVYKLTYITSPHLGPPIFSWFLIIFPRKKWGKKKHVSICFIPFTLWLFNIAMENGP